jgi:hypothetical protein
VAASTVHENLIRYIWQRQDAFPFRRALDARHFLADAVGQSATVMPVPAKIFMLDELEPKGYGFPLTKAPALDDLEVRLRRWLDEELATRSVAGVRTNDLLTSYRDQVVRMAKNARESSVLADYHAAFWLLHSQQAGRAFSVLLRNAVEGGMPRDEAERMQLALHTKWVNAIRAGYDTINGFLALILEHPLFTIVDHVSPDLRELRGFCNAYLRRDYRTFRAAFDELRLKAAELIGRNRVLRRALTQLGYADTSVPHVVALLDPRVRGLLSEDQQWSPPADISLIDGVSRKLLEVLVVQSLRRGIVWMTTTPEGDNVDDTTNTVYSRAIRPMNFGRRGVVEPIVYRYGLVYDITSFTETLGEIARGGQGEEQSSYRQMLDFQRDLAEISRRHGLQFEKFLGDGAFYTSRRALRTVHAAIDIQQFYAQQRRDGFAFNKGMRIALNYGYYRLLPMQVSSDGTQLMEFYGPGIVELSRLTTGKATKEVEDIQHLLLSHGYDQSEVYRFFAPLARGVERADDTQQQREFYAHVNENGHLINEGIVVSIPFIRQLSTEILEEGQKLYRLRTPWSVYLGFPSSHETGGYLGIRLLGSVTLKGIGAQDIGEVVWLRSDEAEISLMEETKPLLQLLQQERHRTSAHVLGRAETAAEWSTNADLVVCESQNDSTPIILVGEWDPVSEEVRRPIRLDGVEAERYGLAVPLTAQSVELQTVAYQKLYRKLSRIETLPSFSVDALRHNANFAGFIIGETVERL